MSLFYKLYLKENRDIAPYMWLGFEFQFCDLVAQWLSQNFLICEIDIVIVSSSYSYHEDKIS